MAVRGKRKIDDAAFSQGPPPTSCKVDQDQSTGRFRDVRSCYPALCFEDCPGRLLTKGCLCPSVSQASLAAAVIAHDLGQASSRPHQDDHGLIIHPFNGRADNRDLRGKTSPLDASVRQFDDADLKLCVSESIDQQSCSRGRPGHPKKARSLARKQQLRRRFCLVEVHRPQVHCRPGRPLGEIELRDRVVPTSLLVNSPPSIRRDRTAAEGFQSHDVLDAERS